MNIGRGPGVTNWAGHGTVAQESIIGMKLEIDNRAHASCQCGLCDVTLTGSCFLRHVCSVSTLYPSGLCWKNQKIVCSLADARGASYTITVETETCFFASTERSVARLSAHELEKTNATRKAMICGNNEDVRCQIIFARYITGMLSHFWRENVVRSDDTSNICCRFSAVFVAIYHNRRKLPALHTCLKTHHLNSYDTWGVLCEGCDFTGYDAVFSCSTSGHIKLSEYMKWGIDVYRLSRWLVSIRVCCLFVAVSLVL